MTRWWTSDTHFGHTRIVELAGRPFSAVDEMDRVMVERWNDVVRPDDEVWHLGDVALGRLESSLGLVRRLHGRKRLIVGNHDRIFEANRPEDRRRHRARYKELFALGCDPSATTTVATPRGTVTVEVCHFPYDGDSHGRERYREYRLPDLGVPLLHGHTHDTGRTSVSKRGTPQFHAGVDAWDFRPVPESEVEAWAAGLAR